MAKTFTENKMNFRNKTFDSQLKKIEGFKKHPHMIPFIGSEWENSKKLLLIGESCGIPSKDGDEKRVLDTWNNWYNIPMKKLTKTQKCNTDIKKVFESDRKKTIQTYKNIKNAIMDSCNKKYKQEDWQIFNYIAFTNFYLRPSLMEDGRHKKEFNEKDKEIGNSALKEIIKIIEPNYIYILSSKVRDKIDRQIFESKPGISCHPSSQWWNKGTKVEPKTGREKFIDFLNKNKIFQ